MLGGTMLKRYAHTSAADFTHTVIGAGAVGLAIAADIAMRFPDANILLLEKNAKYGLETSSRNSEVVHGGLYYPEGSLKAKLCIEGKNMIYGLKNENGAARDVAVRNCGKWIVAQTAQEMEYLQRMHEKAERMGVPTDFVGIGEAKRREPLISARCGILHSPTTGILSAHALMDYQFARFQEAEGSAVFNTKVVGLEYIKSSGIYKVQTELCGASAGADDEDGAFSFTTNALINCAGLRAAEISNMILPENRHIKQYYAKGNYFSYSGRPLGIRRLVYPCPTPGVASLGTHLTIDLGGDVKFGPDLEWVDNCDDYSVNSSNLEAACKQVSLYLPGIKSENLTPSYSGIRPKIIGPNEKRFQDFIIREEKAFPGFINLLGIESPGLTCSMAIGKYVCDRFI
ncbi:hypothetical protein HII12_004144 [Brettanomyces bruxellensis]|uniref:L-2-hydroxyglutarate dehydrogenase, mitochondrial n=1 Tax=Dekkera bruxellensis TaxID=5007 RepID=A0A8H6ES81_DEKBR|nr:hypothetical protein HII12_004144 [Brettanomyces bruxellensis]